MLSTTDWMKTSEIIQTYLNLQCILGKIGRQKIISLNQQERKISFRRNGIEVKGDYKAEFTPILVIDSNNGNDFLDKLKLVLKSISARSGVSCCVRIRI